MASIEASRWRMPLHVMKGMRVASLRSEAIVAEIGGLVAWGFFRRLRQTEGWRVGVSSNTRPPVRRLRMHALLQHRSAGHHNFSLR